MCRLDKSQNQDGTSSCFQDKTFPIELPRQGVDVPCRRHLLHQRAHRQRSQQHGHAQESRLASKGF